MRMKVARILLVWFGLCASLFFASPVLAQPDKIYVGAYINDIQSVDLRGDSHVTDFYIWYRWYGTKHDPSKSVEFMNMIVPVDHTHVSIFDPPKVEPDGSHYAQFHHNGAFSSKFPLRNYPFDTQTLTIELEDTASGSTDLIFVPDTEGATLNPTIRLASYSVGKPVIKVVDRPYPTTFGDLSESNLSSYSRAIISIPIKRPWVSGALKVLLPVGLILLSALLALLIRPDHIEARISLGITALLTLVALQFTAATELPEVDYLMLIDKVYLASYGFILAVLAFVVRGSWLVDHRGVDKSARLDRRAGLLLILLYVAIIAALIIPALLAD